MAGETVLVVDDEPEVADGYALRIGDEYDVETAYSGAEALDLIDESIDVVLLDRRMPEQAGEDVLAEIRRQDYNPMVAMLTAVDPDVDVATMPFDEYLVKPVQREELIETIQALVERKTLDEIERELSSKRVRRNILEVEQPEGILEANEDYQQLVADIERLERELEQYED